ncbi:aspartyl-phosphate phosphatase Spo0E family protein [Paenibacillus sp. LjRoot56]|uniref:aspartyl-phosphate phosphatase Spo0E family protein n=1 Tax=Paenibacillus sp. LjRoot56 TaxID=3342333 RepID=UPI003F500203
MEHFILEKIETLRLQMVQESFKHSNLTHENVIAISHELDRYIALYQKLILGTAIRVPKQNEKILVSY